MCMGTFVMTGLRTLRVAARDRYCGAVHYMEDDPYVKGKNIDVKFEPGDLEFVQLTMQSYYNFRRNNGEPDVVTKQFEKDCPKAVALAEALYKERVLDAWAENGMEFGEVYDRIVESAK